MSAPGGELLSKLLAAGTPVELVAEVAMELARAQAATEILEQRRAKDRMRKSVPRNSTESEESAEFQNKGSLEVSPPAPPLPKPSKVSPLNPPIDRFKSEWNGMAAKHGLPQIDQITGKRLRDLRSRCAEYGVEAVSRAIARVPSCSHWLGENGWRGNFDSLLRPGNFQRMHEGAYLTKAEKIELTPAEQIAQLQRFIPRWEGAGRQADAEEARRKIAELEQLLAA